jgi:DNA invertase Pin-like site-specific DNA recombinase
MGVFAEFERAMIQERIRAGLARARSEGKRLGRPTIPQATEDAIRAALSQPGRPGVRKIAERLGVNPSTVQRLSTPASQAWPSSDRPLTDACPIRGRVPTARGQIRGARP